MLTLNCVSCSRMVYFFFSSRRRHTRCALVTGVQTCALPIWEVERRDASTDADRLAHRIDVDAGARALRIFALQHMRDAAAEFDDVEPALDVAARVGDEIGRASCRERGCQYV